MVLGENRAKFLIISLKNWCCFGCVLGTNWVTFGCVLGVFFDLKLWKINSTKVEYLYFGQRSAGSGQRLG